MYKLKFFTGDTNYKKYGGKFITRKFNNGDFDYWLIVECFNLHDEMGEKNQPKYAMEIKAIAPSEVSQKNMDSAISCCGLGDMIESGNELQKNYLRIEALADYGIFAVLWQGQGDNFDKLLEEARNQIPPIVGLFGFYMDRPENRLGQSGWELIRGQSVREFLKIEKEDEL